MGEIEGSYRAIQTPGTRLGAQFNAGISTLEPGQSLSDALGPGGRSPGRGLQLRVQGLDDSQEFYNLESRADGQTLLSDVFRRSNLMESDYFGLEFQNMQMSWVWLEPTKLVVKQVKRPMNTLFRLSVKFFPPDPGQLQEEYTRYLFSLQMKRDLLEGKLSCTENTASLLASHLLQSEIGDYDDVADRDFLKLNKLLPNQERIQERIMELHHRHLGQTPADSDFQVLEIARKLEMYGVRFHPAADREGTKINLAVAHIGLQVFQGNTKINTFNWSKIRKLSFKRKRFLIKLYPEVHGPHQDTLEFQMVSRDQCKIFWKNCVEHHSFFRLLDQPQPKSKAILFSRGSSFRYSGRTQKQLVEYVKDSGARRTPYQRRNSKVRMSTRSLAPDVPKQTLSFNDSLRAPGSPSSGTGSFHSIQVSSSPLRPEPQIQSPQPPPQSQAQSSHKNTMFAEVVERLKKTEELQADPSVPSYAEPGDIVCDVCTGRKQKAIKSCLLCLASYCETHLKLHDKLNPGKRHRLEEASIQLQEKICSQHDKLLEVYCRTDQLCICYECLMGVHKGHETVSAVAESTEKQKELKEAHKKSKQVIKRKEKELLRLKQAMESLTYSAQVAVEDSDKVFDEMIRSVEKCHSDVKRLIRSQENAAVGQAEEQVDQLQKEIAELRRRDAELGKLSKTKDSIIFLQSCQSILALPECGDSCSINVSQQVSFEGVKKSVAELKQRLEDICKGTFIKISKKVQDVHILQPSKPSPPLPQIKETFVESKVPTTREEFWKYACQLTLDLNTAHKNLLLSKDNKEAVCKDVALPYPDHPERFVNNAVVLCREALSGRCYWEVEWSGVQVIMGVAYKGINRKMCPRNDNFDWILNFHEQTWSLDVFGRCVWENTKQTKQLPFRPSKKIGLYLDHKAGSLTFYNITDTMTLLYRVQTTFTQPLYPVFWIKIQSGMKLCRMK